MLIARGERGDRRTVKIKRREFITRSTVRRRLGCFVCAQQG